MSNLIETERYIECQVCKEKHPGQEDIYLQAIPWDGRVWVGRAELIEKVNQAFRDKHKNCK